MWNQILLAGALSLKSLTNHMFKYYVCLISSSLPLFLTTRFINNCLPPSSGHHSCGLYPAMCGEWDHKVQENQKCLWLTFPPMVSTIIILFMNYITFCSLAVVVHTDVQKEKRLSVLIWALFEFLEFFSLPSHRTAGLVPQVSQHALCSKLVTTHRQRMSVDFVACQFAYSEAALLDVFCRIPTWQQLCFLL